MMASRLGEKKKFKGKEFSYPAYELEDVEVSCHQNRHLRNAFCCCVAGHTAMRMVGGVWSWMKVNKSVNIKMRCENK
jgi:hypothetical protein